MLYQRCIDGPKVALDQARFAAPAAGTPVAPWAAMTAIRLTLTAVLTCLMGFLVLQALGYGVGFAVNPASGVNEFGYGAPTVVDDLTVALVGLIGVGMLGVAALLVQAAILVWRANPAGTYIAMTTGVIYVLLGLQAVRAEWWWDAWFYSLTGALLVLLSAAVRWAPARGRDAA